MTDTQQTEPIPEVEDRQITHYLMNFTGVGEPAGTEMLALRVGEAITSCGVELLMATTYVSEIGLDPRDVGIKDTWLNAAVDHRVELSKRFPHLVTALDLICGITSRDL